MSGTVYLDNSATTRVDERVLRAMTPYMVETYAVATSEFAYSLGIEAREALEESRSRLAGLLRAKPEEVVFTSGGTESSNTALKGAAMASGGEGHLIVSGIEDFPVLNTAKALERDGHEVIYLPVDAEGLVDPGTVSEAIRKDTFLVSVQHANQEIGTVQDIAEIARACSEQDILFHTDATHTFTKLDIDVERIPVDLITLSGHTIHGPRGIGALFTREDVKLGKLMDGGFQESDRRAGVENIPGAVGLAKAAELVTQEEVSRLGRMRDRLLDRVSEEVPDTTLNGHRTERTPQNANVTFHFVEGEAITLHLDMHGFAVSTGSACFSKSLEASHVIRAIGGDHERAHGSVRFTFGRFNTMEETDSVVDAVGGVVERLREISPLRPKKEGGAE